MLTSIRYATASVADADLTAITKYPSELIKREHQDIPITYKGNLTFSQVGKVYLRAYMEVAGVDYWSPEVVLEVTPVVPTGTVFDFTLEVGAGFASEATPDEAVVVLGDAIRVVDEDPVMPHTCSRTSGPAETADLAGGEPVLMVVPGVYEYTCNTLQETGFKVVVQV
jgi:hypothetical protein